MKPITIKSGGWGGGGGLDVNSYVTVNYLFRTKSKISITAAIFYHITKLPSTSRNRSHF